MVTTTTPWPGRPCGCDDARMVAIVERREPGPAGERACRDLLGVAWTGLKARKEPDLLIMLGPVIGVAAMVSAVGLTESAKGALQVAAGQAGDEPISPRPAGSFGSQNPTSRRRRARGQGHLDGHQRRGHHQSLGVVAVPIAGAARLLRGLSCPVRAADTGCPRCSRSRWSTDGG